MKKSDDKLKIKDKTNVKMSTFKWLSNINSTLIKSFKAIKLLKQLIKISKEKRIGFKPF